MAKLFKYDQEARDALFKGVEVLNRCVSTTLGPKGRNVALGKKWVSPVVLHDGVSVAKDIELKDPFENVGAQLMKEAAQKTNDDAGDGTTTATLLAYEMTRIGMEHLKNNINPMSLKKGMDRAVDMVALELEKLSQKIVTTEQIGQVATISSANDEIGKLIAIAIAKVGKDGLVTVEEGSTLETSVDYKEGMEFDKGFVSPHFATDPERGECVIESPYILITDQKVSSPQDLVKVFEKIVSNEKREDIVVIAEDFEDMVVNTMLINKMKGSLKVLAIKAPGFGDRRKEMLEDIAVLTGGTVITKELGVRLEDVEVIHLGRADRIISDKDHTQVVGGFGKADDITKRITQIKNQIDKEESEFEKEKLQERLAKLTGGVAIMKVGAQTEVEMKEMKERVIDAVAATKSALQEGVVSGGGVALLRARKVLSEFLLEKTPYALGVQTVYRALEAPIKKIVENAGADKNMDIVTRVDTIDKDDYGYDVETENFGSMMTLGIIDPTRVVRMALQNAVSIASMILTTNVIICDAEENLSPVNHLPEG